MIARRRQRSITFASHDTVCEIPHLNDMTDEELLSVYMSRDELCWIRKDCKNRISKMDQGHSKGICTLGLDRHTEEYTNQAKEIREMIYDAIDAVQQFQQKFSDQDNTALIAKLSQRCSSISIDLARSIGQADAKKARKVHGLLRKTTGTSNMLGTKKRSEKAGSSQSCYSKKTMPQRLSVDVPSSVKKTTEYGSSNRRCRLPSTLVGLANVVSRNVNTSAIHAGGVDGALSILDEDDGNRSSPP